MDRHIHRHTGWLLWTPFQCFRIFSFNLSSRIGPIYQIKFWSSKNTFARVTTHLGLNIIYRLRPLWLRTDVMHAAIPSLRQDTTQKYPINHKGIRKTNMKIKDQYFLLFFVVVVFVFVLYHGIYLSSCVHTCMLIHIINVTCNCKIYYHID